MEPGDLVAPATAVPAQNMDQQKPLPCLTGTLTLIYLTVCKFTQMELMLNVEKLTFTSADS